MALASVNSVLLAPSAPPTSALICWASYHQTPQKSFSPVTRLHITLRLSPLEGGSHVIRPRGELWWYGGVVARPQAIYSTARAVDLHLVLKPHVQSMHSKHLSCGYQCQHVSTLCCKLDSFAASAMHQFNRRGRVLASCPNKTSAISGFCSQRTCSRKRRSAFRWGQCSGQSGQSGQQAFKGRGPGPGSHTGTSSLSETPRRTRPLFW